MFYSHFYEIFTPNIIEFGKNIGEKENIYEEISHYRNEKSITAFEVRW